MLEDNEMQFLVDALNVMPNKTVLVPKFFQDPMIPSIQFLAQIRFILTKAIGATDRPHIYKITIQGYYELGIKRNDELLSPEERVQKIADMEYKRLSEVDPWFLENYEKTWETDENDE